MWPNVLRNPSFRRLWAASTIDSFGSWLLVMAVPLQAFLLTGSAMSTGIALAVQALPAVAIGPWAGVVTDRWHRRRIIVIANLASAVGVALMTLATDADRLAFIYVGLLVESVAVCFLRPALAAVTPAVVGNEPDLASANALSAFVNSAFRMLGPLLGTYLVARGWFQAVVLVDVASYLAAAAIVMTITAIPVAPPRRTTRRITAELRAGMRHIVRTPLLRGLLTTSGIYWTANASLTALLIPFVADRLHASGQTLGHLIAGLGVGYLCGSAISKTLISRYATRTVLTIAYAAVGLCFLAMFTATTPQAAVIAVTVCGVPGAVAQIVTGHRVQASTPDEVLGRVSAAFYAGDSTAAVVGALIAPAVVALAGLGTALIAFSAAVLGTAAVAAVVLPPSTPGRPGRASPAQRHRRAEAHERAAGEQLQPAVDRRLRHESATAVDRPGEQHVPAGGDQCPQRTEGDARGEHRPVVGDELRQQGDGEDAGLGVAEIGGQSGGVRAPAAAGVDHG
ncbi:MFS transporter [Catellatospora paridis]